MARMNIPEEVRKAAENNTRKQREEFLQLVKEQLNGERAVGFYGNHYRNKVEDFFLDGRHIKVLPVRVLRKDEKDEEKTVKKYTGYYVAFDVDKIELNSEVELKVPSEKTRMFVGTKAWQVAEWCRKLGLKKIKVAGIKKAS